MNHITIIFIKHVNKLSNSDLLKHPNCRHAITGNGLKLVYMDEVNKLTVSIFILFCHQGIYFITFAIAFIILCIIT